MTPRALLTDFDGVLRRWDPANALRAEAIGGLPSGAIARAAFAPALLLPAIRGEVTDEEWRDRVARALVSPTLSLQLARRVVRAWSAHAGELDPGVLGLLERLSAAGCALVLVTNATTRLPADLAALGLEATFDHVLNSSALGSEKPHPPIYEAALEAAGVEASEALFVDDSLANVEAARQLGVRALRFDVHTDRTETLEAWLVSHGLVF